MRGAYFCRVLYKHNVVVVNKIGAYIDAYFVWVPIILILGICFTCSYVKYCIRHMWQSCVDIEGYSVTYFDRIAPTYRSTSVQGRAHLCFVDA